MLVQSHERLKWACPSRIVVALLALTCLLLSCARHASSQGAQATPLPRPVEVETRKPSGAPSPGFSWSVRGRSAVITLVGSIHVGFKGLYPLPEPVEAAFSESSVLATELALDQEPPEQVAEMMIREALVPEGKQLRDYLSDRTWLRYQSFAKEHSDQALFFDRFHPWFVAAFLSSEQATVDGYEADQGIDLHFFKQRGNRKVVGVEKAEQQIKALAELPSATQDLMLAEQLDAMSRHDNELQSLIECWKKGDVEGLERALFEEFKDPEYVAVYETLIVKRNDRMTRQIEQWLAGNERVFVVLGAAHFIGKDGIVAQLQRDGWSPERL
jgi:uncharacterized protein